MSDPNNPENGNNTIWYFLGGAALIGAAAYAFTTSSDEETDSESEAKEKETKSLDGVVDTLV